MRVGTLILILSVLAVALGACDRSKDSAAGVGPIARVLPQGRNGPWLGEMTDAAYRMTNTQDPATIQYYFLDPVPGTEGRRSVSVEIAIESRGEGTRAGLVYGVTASPTAASCSFSASRPERSPRCGIAAPIAVQETS